MQTSSTCDVLVIGSGAGGAPLACVLAEAGFDVIVVEKGPRLSRPDYIADEITITREKMFVPSVEDDPHTVVTRQNPNPLVTDLGWIASCVGGGTVHMGGFLYRFHPDDFRMRSRFGTIEEIADWPYSYADLRPYYALAEQAVGVSGADSSHPWAPPRDENYPLPPVADHEFASVLDGVCRDRGLSPFPTPRSINSQPYQDRPACPGCTACAGYGCPVGAKGSVQETVLARAERTSRCRVIANTMVREIEVDGRGRARGCWAVSSDGTEREITARVVCISCSAIESARLLLLSRSSRFPDGLANRSGLVGRHLQFHAVTMGAARIPKERYPILKDPYPLMGRSLWDYYFLPDGVAEIAKGGLLRFGFEAAGPIQTAMAMAHDGPSTVWGEQLSERLREHYRDYRTLSFEFFHDFLPNEGTFVELDPDTQDKWGLQVARIHLDLPQHHRTVGQWLLERAREIVEDLGAADIETEAVGGTSSYLVHGTCRAGNDPSRSVVDGFCRTHDVDNLYIVDGSFMPTSGGAAPTLTVLANSFRTAEQIRRRLESGNL